MSTSYSASFPFEEWPEIAGDNPIKRLGRFRFHHTSDIFFWEVWPADADFSGTPISDYAMTPPEYSAMVNAVLSDVGAERKNDENRLARAVISETKHGPCGGGCAGPCDVGCLKCFAERLCKP